MPEKYKLPLEKLYQWEREIPSHVFLRQPYPGKGYVETTFSQAMHDIRRIATAIKAKGFPPGSNIAILSKNCAHWMMADYAIWMAGHVSVPLYPNLSETSVREILNHSESKMAFLGKLDSPDVYRRGVDKSLPCIAFPYHTFENADSWDDVVRSTQPMTTNPTRSMGELATIIYTSGTTGEPKGVMQPFSSFAIAGTEILSVVAMTPQDRFFSYLPLAHVAERILVQTCGLYAGASVSFAESLDSFQENLKSVQPTVFLSVPRLWQKFQSGVLGKMPQKKLKFFLALPFIGKRVKQKIKTALGLAEARIIVTGAAPTPPSLIEWFKQLDILIEEAYGMTENFAYSHFNLPGKVKIGTVGQPWPLVETKIGADGEVLIKSPGNFRGYYRSSQKRTDLFEGEFFKTGDRGEIDSQGYLKITGRTKELFKTSKGKYIAPAPIETKLMTSPLLEAGCVMGANLSQPLALAILSPAAATMDRNVLKNELSAHLSAVNAQLDPHEKLKHLVITKDSWTIENGILTPTLKVKRSALETRYNASLEKWLSLPDQVVFE